MEVAVRKTAIIAAAAFPACDASMVCATTRVAAGATAATTARYVPDTGTQPPCVDDLLACGGRAVLSGGRNAGRGLLRGALRGDLAIAVLVRVVLRVDRDGFLALGRGELGLTIDLFTDAFELVLQHDR